MVGFDANASLGSLDTLVKSSHVGNVIYLGGWDGADKVTRTSKHLQGLVSGKGTGDVGLLIAAELDVLASAKNGRRICGCADRACCKHGYDSMVADPRGHAARQFFNSIAKLEAVPDLRRDTGHVGIGGVAGDGRAGPVAGGGFAVTARLPLAPTGTATP